MTNFLVYMVGMLLVVGAVAYGMHFVGIPGRWIGVAVAALLGIGVMGAIVKTRQKDPS